MRKIPIVNTVIYIDGKNMMLRRHGEIRQYCSCSGEPHTWE